LGTQRSFLFMTAAARRFVKIRVTLRGNDATDRDARNFADAVARGLWSKRANEKVARRNVRMIASGRFEILELVGIAVFGAWWWHTADLNEPKAKGAIFRCYEEGNDQELAYLLVVDVSEDPDEPDIADIKPESVAELDKFLETEIRKLLPSDGRRMVRWMSSKLNETPTLRSLITAYVAEDQGRERQYIDMRIPVRGRKVVVGGCFDVKRAAEFAAPILSALQSVVILNRLEN
jgi:hypothetical protein